MNLIDRVNELLKGKGKLLYLTKFGSHLYGTSSPDSDLDLKGIFLPNIDHFYSGNSIKQVTYNTGDDISKNGKDDIDITLYTLQYFIHGLASKGDTGALDMLFSHTNRDCIIFNDYDITRKLVGSIDKVLDLKNSNAYIGYCVGQARRYGIKGSRLGVLKNVFNLLNGDSIKKLLTSEVKLIEITPAILDKFYDESYCFKKTIKEDDYLVICGACHQLNVSLLEFYSRIVNEMKKYGGRTNTALEAGGIDYKALSHAVRVLSQCKELYEHGSITFPRPDKESILKIKKGQVSYDKIEEMILNGLSDVDKVKANCKYDYQYDNKFCTGFIKGYYA